MNLYNLPYLVYKHYFLIICISSVLGICFGMKQYLISVLQPVVCFYLAFNTPKRCNTNIFDILVACIFCSSIISWLTNDYSSKVELIYRHILGPINYMMGYYIGRNMNVNESYSIFRTSLIPVLIVSIIGLYCFFFNPGWYVNGAAFRGFDSLRLRSIFPSPYTITYYLAFLLGFISLHIFQHNGNVKQYKYCIPFFVITLLLGLMRTPIVAVLIFFFISLLHSCIYNGQIKVLLYSFFAVVLLCFTITIVLKNTDTMYVEGIYEKFEVLTDDDNEYIEKRYKLHEADISLFGDGAGRHNIWAEDYGQQSIRDGEYQKLKQEVGVVGETIYIILITLIVLKCLVNFRNLPFELSCMLFLLISMIGANPLSTCDKHSLIFWLIIGRVSSYNTEDEDCRLLLGEIEE